MEVQVDLTRAPTDALLLVAAVGWHKRASAPGFYEVLVGAITEELRRREHGFSIAGSLSWPADLSLAETIKIGYEVAAFHAAAAKAAGDDLEPGGDAWANAAVLLGAIMRGFVEREATLAAGGSAGTTH